MSAQSKISGGQTHQDWVLWSSILAISLMWGSTFLFVKLLGVEIPPFALTAIRAGIAVAALAIWAISSGYSFRFSRQQLMHMMVLGGFNSLLPNLLTAFATFKVDSAQAGMINATNPILTAIFASFLMRDEKLGWQKILGIALGFFGIFVLIGPQQVMNGDSDLLGQLQMLAVATSYALGTIYGRWVRAFNAVQLSLGQFLFTFVPAAVISFGVEPPWTLSFTPTVAALLLVLGVVCAAIPNVLFLYLLKQYPATNVSTITYLMPIWAIILSLSIFHASLSPNLIVGCAVILLGVWIVNWQGQRWSNTST